MTVSHLAEAQPGGTDVADNHYVGNLAWDRVLSQSCPATPELTFAEPEEVVSGHIRLDHAWGLKSISSQIVVLSITNRNWN